MALACSECGHKLELSDADRRRLAGKFVACPECGVSKRLPLMPSKPETARPGAETPAEIFAKLAIADMPSQLRSKTRNEQTVTPVVPVDPQPPPINDWATREEILAGDQGSWWQRMPWPKRAIFVATIAWVIFTPLLGLAEFSSKYTEYTRLENKMFVHKETRAVRTEGELISLCVARGLGAIVVPTICYAFSMVPLTVIWFCLKDSLQPKR